MKIPYFKISVLCTLLLSIGLTSCSDDDDAVQNQAPEAFNLISVPDGASNVDLKPQLNWQAATDPDGDAVNYQVYLDTQNPPEVVIANSLEVSTFKVAEELQPGTTYYWMVVAKDTNGNTTKSNTTSFTTSLSTAQAIAGKWFYDNIQGDPYSGCAKESFYNFKEDLSIQIQEYNGTNGDCEVYNSKIGTYELLGNNQIKYVSSFGIPEVWEITSLTETKLILDIGYAMTFNKE